MTVEDEAAVMVEMFGARAPDMLVEKLTTAVKAGDEPGIEALDRLLQSVDRLLSLRHDCLAEQSQPTASSSGDV